MRWLEQTVLEVQEDIPLADRGMSTLRAAFADVNISKSLIKLAQ